MLNTTRRSALFGAASAALFAPKAWAEGSDLAFLVVGDWGDHDTDTQHAVAAAMGRVAGRIGTNFVVSTGDNFYEAGVQSIDDPQWRTSFEEVYTAQSLQTPWYAVLGNHDHNGRPEAEIAYSANSSRWRMPNHYWRQDMTLPGGGDVAFFFLDTTPIDRFIGLRDMVPGADFGARAQIAWLERELAASRADWKFVVGHHPILSSGNHGPSEGMQHHVRPLLERYGVQAYFNGHDHDLEFLQQGSVSYICSGSGAEVRSVIPVPMSRFAAAEAGFVVCQLGREAMQVRFFDKEGAVLYQGMVTRR